MPPAQAPVAYAAKEPDGIGVGKPAHPFAATVEAQVPVGFVSGLYRSSADVVECYRTRWIWNQVSCLPHHHRRGFVHSPLSTRVGSRLTTSLPTGTQLPGGAVLPMSSVADFPMVLPEGKSSYP
jgi:hypothetical protein